jgi:hypothetical protein
MAKNVSFFGWWFGGRMIFSFWSVLTSKHYTCDINGPKDKIQFD